MKTIKLKHNKSRKYKGGQKTLEQIKTDLLPKIQNVYKITPYTPSDIIEYIKSLKLNKDTDRVLIDGIHNFLLENRYKFKNANLFFSNPSIILKAKEIGFNISYKTAHPDYYKFGLYVEPEPKFKTAIELGIDEKEPKIMEKYKLYYPTDEDILVKFDLLSRRDMFIFEKAVYNIKNNNGLNTLPQLFIKYPPDNNQSLAQYITRLIFKYRKMYKLQSGDDFDNNSETNAKNKGIMKKSGIHNSTEGLMNEISWNISSRRLGIKKKNNSSYEFVTKENPNKENTSDTLLLSKTRKRKQNIGIESV